MSVKISELPILDSLADNDVIAGVDTSANVTSKIEMATLKNYIDTNTQYTAGTNINITNNVISAPFVYDKTQTNALLDDFKDETNALIEDLETNINEQLEEKDEQIEELQSEVDSLSMIYNAFPTESGEGESLTLDDTAEVKFKKFDLKGNTSQFSTTGINLAKVDYSFNQTTNGITCKVNSDGSISLSGTASANTTFIMSTGLGYSSGTYAMSCVGMPTNSDSIRIRFRNSNASYSEGDQTNTAEIVYNRNPRTFTNRDVNNFEVFVFSGVTLNSTIKVQLQTGSSATSFEPYTNGASPNPSYPQLINVVSGDNEINVVGKNLYNANDTTYYSACTYVSGVNSNQYKVKATGADVIINTQISSGTSYSSNAGTLIPCKYGETIYYDTGNSNFTKNIVTQYNSNKVSLGFSLLNTGSSSGSYTPTDSDCEYISIRIGYGSATSGTEYTLAPIFSKISNLPYEPYQSNTYNIDLPVENLAELENGSLWDNNGAERDLANSVRTKFISFESGMTITPKIFTSLTTRYLQYCLYDSSKTFISLNNFVDGTAITTSNTSVKYIRFKMTGPVNGSMTIDDIKFMVVKGDKAPNKYTPYGTTPIELCSNQDGTLRDYFLHDKTLDKWYWHREIGEVVLNGSEMWQVHGSLASWFYVDNLIYSVSANTRNDFILSDYFVQDAYMNATSITNGKMVYSYQVGGGPARLVLKDTDYTTVADFKAWLSTHNVKLYYVLATPTNTEITYQPLIDQLNELEKAQSKENQTNISQVNNDLPFIISASALKKWSV